MKCCRTVLVALLAVLVAPARLAADTPIPSGVEQVDVIEHLGEKVPLDLTFASSTGKTVRLSDALSKQHPIILTLVYFRCPMLCSTVLRGLVRSLKTIEARPGTDVDLVTVSFDPADGPTGAVQQRHRYLDSFGIPDESPTWPFLTGGEPQIHALAEAVGFRYARVPRSTEFAHPAVVFLLTEDGTISRYLYGVDFPQRDLRLAIAEASGGGWGKSFDRFLLHCFRYDPASRRYGFYISTYFRVGGAVVLLLLGALIASFAMVRRKRLQLSGGGDLRPVDHQNLPKND